MFFIKKLFLFWKTNTTLCSFFNAKEEALLHSSVNVSLLLINEISHNESLINYLLLLFKIHVYNWKKKNQLNITNKCSAKNKLKWVKCLEFRWLKLNAFKVSVILTSKISPCGALNTSTACSDIWNFEHQ